METPRRSPPLAWVPRFVFNRCGSAEAFGHGLKTTRGGLSHRRSGLALSAPKGRSSIARGANPWTNPSDHPASSRNPKGVSEPLCGIAFLSPLRGLHGWGYWGCAGSRGFHPWLWTTAPSGRRRRGEIAHETIPCWIPSRAGQERAFPGLTKTFLQIALARLVREGRDCFRLIGIDGKDLVELGDFELINDQRSVQTAEL